MSSKLCLSSFSRENVFFFMFVWLSVLFLLSSFSVTFEDPLSAFCFIHIFVTSFACFFIPDDFVLFVERNGFQINGLLLQPGDFSRLRLETSSRQCHLRSQASAANTKSIITLSSFFYEAESICGAAHVHYKDYFNQHYTMCPREPLMMSMKVVLRKLKSRSTQLE